MIITCTVSIALMCLVGNATEEQNNIGTPKAARREIGRLVEVLTNESNFKDHRGLVAEAMVKLGEMKAVEAVPLLIEHINFYDSRHTNELTFRTLMVDSRVAVPALVKIGMPALDPIIQAARKEDDMVRMVCMGAVVRGIEGREKGFRVVQEAVATAPDEAEQKRLGQLAYCVIVDHKISSRGPITPLIGIPDHGAYAYLNKEAKPKEYPSIPRIEARTPPSAYELEGVFEQEINYPQSTFNKKGTFSIFVRNRSWLIRTVEYNQNRRPGLKREIGSTNGTETFEIVTAGPSASAAAGSTNGGDGKLKQLAEPILAMATISSNTAPVGELDGAVVGHLWLMLTSDGYLSRLTNDLLIPVYSVGASAAGNPNLRRKAEWELIGGAGSLPMNVTYFTRDGNVAAVYRATGLTNVNGVGYPTKFIFEEPGPRKARKRAKVEVTAIRPFCTLSNLLPEVTAKTLVSDSRVREETNRTKAFLYEMAPGEKWHTLTEAQKLHPPKKKPPKASPVMIPLIATLLGAPLVIWAAISWWRWRKRQ